MGLDEVEDGKGRSGIQSVVISREVEVIVNAHF